MRETTQNAETFGDIAVQKNEQRKGKEIHPVWLQPRHVLIPKFRGGFRVSRRGNLFFLDHPSCNLSRSRISLTS